MSYEAVIFDFGGVLTTSLDACARAFAREQDLEEDAYLHAIAVNPTGRALYAQLERGDITQEEWNLSIAALLGIDSSNLMGRALATLRPEPLLIAASEAIRTAGLKTAVLSNSMGMSPFNPYAPWDLEAHHHVVVLSEQCRLRKPDPQIYQLALDRLGLPGSACIFVDDNEANLPPARALGMTTVWAQEPNRTTEELQRHLGIPLPKQPAPVAAPKVSEPGADTGAQ